MRKLDSKEIIAEAFKQLVALKGFDAVSVGDIAKESACSRATFYYHFKDKYDVALWIFVTDLVEAWNGRRGADWIELMEDVLRILKDNPEYYREVLAYDGQNSLTEFARTSFITYAAKNFGCEIENLALDVRYAVSIFIGGLVLAWRDWLKGDDVLSVHDFAIVLGQNVPKVLFYTAGGPLPVDPTDYLIACYQKTL